MEAPEARGPNESTGDRRLSADRASHRSSIDGLFHTVTPPFQARAIGALKIPRLLRVGLRLLGLGLLLGLLLLPPLCA